MFALVKPFVDICLLKKGPQDLPTSDLLLVIALVAYALSEILLSTIYLPIDEALLAGLTQTALLAVLTLSVLYMQRLHARFKQTLTALAGSGTLLGLIALPVTNWQYTAQEGGDGVLALAIILLGLIGWSLTVVGHILRHALSTVFLLGLILAIAFYWISISILSALFPVVV